MLLVAQIEKSQEILRMLMKLYCDARDCHNLEKGQGQITILTQTIQTLSQCELVKHASLGQ